MRLIQFTLEGLALFGKHPIHIDLYATDRVASNTAASARRFKGKGKNVTPQTVVAITGLNATGKTTVLRAINLAYDITRGIDLNPAHAVYGPLTSLIGQTGLDFTGIIEHHGGWYMLESHIDMTGQEPGTEDDAYGSDIPAFRFTKERLLRHVGHTVTKTELADPDEFKKACTLLLTRNVGGPAELNEDEKRFLPDDISIIHDTVREYPPVLNHFDILRNPYWVPSMPGSIVQTFDKSIESIEVDEDGRAHLRFVDHDRDRIMPMVEVAQLLSVGTLRGGRIIRTALQTLKSGGVLLVDEIENSLNKKLVETIMDMFTFPRTNPRGALLAFTTHYPELLNHVERIDSIYVTTRQDVKEGANLRKYSDMQPRADLNRADMLLSNRFGGTAPDARRLNNLFDYVERYVTGGDGEQRKNA